MSNLKEIKNIIYKTASLIEREKQENEFYKKGDFNFVTAVDIKVQDFLKEELSRLEPNVAMLSEESDEGVDLSHPAWVLDPVDGTTNLMHGHHEYAISLALWDGREFELGIIFNPVTGEMFSAKRGEGAYLGDERIAVSETKTLEDSLIAVETSPYNKELTGSSFKKISEVFSCCRDIRCIGSSALDLAYVACGRMDGYFTQILWPWDWAAGSTILSEAGGICSKWDGSKLSPWDEMTNLVAGNADIYSVLLDMIERE
jgi:myo-inositol-1(or 4)-monophosphatase